MIGRPDPARPIVVFAVTAVGAFMAALDLSIVNVAFPDIEASYPDASQASLAWIITAYAIVFGVILVGLAFRPTTCTSSGPRKTSGPA